VAKFFPWFTASYDLTCILILQSGSKGAFIQSARLRPVAFVLLCLIWGSTWLVIKVGYGGLGALTVAALRFLLAGLVMASLVPLMRARWPRGTNQWFLVAFVGAVLFAGDYGLIYWAELTLDSSLTAILFAVNPVLTVLAAHVYLPGERATLRKLGGALVALAGVAVLFGRSVRVDASLALPMLAVVGGAATGALGSVATKRHGKNLHPAALNAPAMLIGSVILALAAIARGEELRLPTGTGAWWAILYLSLVGSVVTFLLYFWLLKTWSATTVSFISVFTPLVALVLGFAILGEKPTIATFVGTALILGGVALALLTPSSNRRGTETQRKI
jgi:drug/metabolite transporter (DMT)-like permease